MNVESDDEILEIKQLGYCKEENIICINRASLFSNHETGKWKETSVTVGGQSDTKSVLTEISQDSSMGTKWRLRTRKNDSKPCSATMEIKPFVDEQQSSLYNFKCYLGKKSILPLIYWKIQFEDLIIDEDTVLLSEEQLLNLLTESKGQNCLILDARKEAPRSSSLIHRFPTDENTNFQRKRLINILQHLKGNEIHLIYFHDHNQDLKELRIYKFLQNLLLKKGLSVRHFGLLYGATEHLISSIDSIDFTNDRFFQPLHVLPNEKLLCLFEKEPFQELELAFLLRSFGCIDEEDTVLITELSEVTLARVAEGLKNKPGLRWVNLLPQTSAPTKSDYLGQFSRIVKTVANQEERQNERGIKLFIQGSDDSVFFLILSLLMVTQKWYLFDAYTHLRLVLRKKPTLSPTLGNGHVKALNEINVRLYLKSRINSGLKKYFREREKQTNNFDEEWFQLIQSLKSRDSAKENACGGSSFFSESTVTVKREPLD
ncbi:hypothetical protein Ciccas_003401 [Cichlidogyrus casuarinus]|uniref:Uncharacterized protein n=1 Tax=Cichlidogyrus casuarinus TaxID=1844966 RepID=A0ABD2QEG1_9PLAT